jgi:hypothetical protein
MREGRKARERNWLESIGPLLYAAYDRLSAREIPREDINRTSRNLYLPVIGSWPICLLGRLIARHTRARRNNFSEIAQLRPLGRPSRAERRAISSRCNLITESIRRRGITRTLRRAMTMTSHACNSTRQAMRARRRLRTLFYPRI